MWIQSDPYAHPESPISGLRRQPGGGLISPVQRRRITPKSPKPTASLEVLPSVAPETPTATDARRSAETLAEASPAEPLRRVASSFALTPTATPSARRELPSVTPSSAATPDAEVADTVTPSRSHVQQEKGVRRSVWHRLQTLEPEVATPSDLGTSSPSGAAAVACNNGKGRPPLPHRRPLASVSAALVAAMGAAVNCKHGCRAANELGGKAGGIGTPSSNSALRHGCARGYAACKTLKIQCEEDGCGNEVASRAPSPAYGRACAALNILPKFERVAREALQGEELDLGGSGLGDEQLAALLADIDLMPSRQIRRWRLKDVRLTNVGVVALAKRLADETEMLDLSQNDIGKKGACELGRLMGTGSMLCLRRLDLSGNGLRDCAIAEMAEGIRKCSFLLWLDLSRNLIRDGVALGNVVGDLPRLMRLSARRNVLVGLGMAAVFAGILRSGRNGGQLSDIDVAWNLVGSSHPMAAAEAIAVVMKESATLYHCDLSYNGMDADCCERIAQGLRDNHSLYGLHMVGNAATMDANGFLVPLRTEDAKNRVEHVQRGSRGQSDGVLFGDPLTGNHGMLGAVRPADKGPGPLENERDARLTIRSASKARKRCVDDGLGDRDVLEQQTACWACEGWERVEIEWFVEPGAEEPRAVWAFTCLDGFTKGLRLKRTEDNTNGGVRFTAARMAPPGYCLRVIFQVDAALRLAPGGDVEYLHTPVEIRLLACPELPELDPPADQDVASWGAHPVIRMRCAGAMTSKAVKPAQADIGPVGTRIVVLDSPDGAGEVVMPRVTEAEYRARRKKQRTKAFHADFRRDRPDVLRHCMLTDFRRCRLGRVVCEFEVPAVQRALEQHYEQLIAIYRRMSALDVTGDSEFGVSQLQAAEFMTSAGLAGDSITKIRDLDRLFITAKVTSKELRNELVVKTEKTLSRYEFIEFLLRVAYQRYIQTATVTTMQEAIQLVLDAVTGEGRKRVEELDRFFSAFHTEAVDDVYKKHMANLEVVFQRYSTKLAGRANTMQLGGFQRVMDVMGAYDTVFQQRHSAFAFRMGMITQCDESGSARFREMSFIEFEHALGAAVFLRAAGKVGEHMAELIDRFFADKLPAAVAA